MEEKNDGDKLDDVMLPGFRFHPTDEELVGFYLKKKIQHQSLPIELIKQVDIYKYDPWDLPKLASTGEKEWYFYCPRDRKYRNSARPNRVTGSGFWKATGTDRPIYSSDGNKCIGLKKSLVFYRGRAAKGIKTDWMMHEFRLPSIPDSAPPKKFLDKNLPANESWAICRIFKKTNSMAQRAFSHSWISTLPETATSDIFTQGSQSSTRFSSENISCTTETGPSFQFCDNGDLNQTSTTSFSALDIPSYKPMNPTFSKLSQLPNQNEELPSNFMFLPLDSSGATTKFTTDVASMLYNNLSPALTGDDSKTSENVNFGGPQQYNYFSINSPQDMQASMGIGEDNAGVKKNPSVSDANDQWESVRSFGFPFSLLSSQADEWKPNLPWDSPPCPSEISTTYSTNKRYN